MQVDPIHQFQIHDMVPMINMGGHQIAFTNSALFMMIIVVGVSALMIGASAPRAVVPGRLQSIAELSYEFVANTVRSSAGTEGMKFFPFVFTLFMFVLFANLIGLIPYSFTVTSQIIITAALALTVFLIVVVYGFWRNGLHFLNLFVPKGVPKVILPAIVIIEVLSPSTERFDRTTKFDWYKKLPSLEHYLLIAQNAVSIEQRTRQGDGSWATTVTTDPMAEIPLQNINCLLSVAATYKNVPFR